MLHRCPFGLFNPPGVYNVVMDNPYESPKLDDAPFWTRTVVTIAIRLFAGVVLVASYAIPIALAADSDASAILPLTGMVWAAGIFVFADAVAERSKQKVKNALFIFAFAAISTLVVGVLLATGAR